MGSKCAVLKIRVVPYPLPESLWSDYDNHFQLDCTSSSLLLGGLHYGSLQINQVSPLTT